MPPKEKAKAKSKKDEHEPDGPAPPNMEKFKDEEAALTSEIARIQGEHDALKAQIQVDTQEKEDHYDKKTALDAEVKTYHDRITALNAHRDALRSGLKSKGDEKKKATQDLKNAEKSLTCKTEEELMDRIREIEFRISTETMPLVDEKRLLQEIQALKKKKPQIPVLNATIAHLKTVAEDHEGDKSLSIKDQITAAMEQANATWNQMQVVKKQRDDLVAAWDEKHKDSKGIQEKCAMLRNDQKTLTTKRYELRSQMQKEKAAWEMHQKEQRRQAQEKRNAEHALQREQWEKTKYERDLEKVTTTMPHLAEITALEQSISFLKTLLPKEEVTEKQNAAQEFNNPEGSMVLLNKKDRDEECFYVNPKKKGPHKKNKAKSTVIKHNAETFRLFDALKVKAPSSVDQIPDTLTQLQEQLDKYNGLVAEWQRKLDDGTLLKEFQEQRPAASDATE